MGGAINRSLISVHFCISPYFPTIQTYKCMRLTNRAYSIYFLFVMRIQLMFLMIKSDWLGVDLVYHM